MKHTAITIGPLYQTITNVKSTKAIWAASYLFSWIMRELLAKITEQKGVNLLMPFYDKEVDEKITVKAGLYPDRCMFTHTEDVDIKSIKEEVIKELTEKVRNDLANKTTRSNKIACVLNENHFSDLETYLTQYLKIDHVTVDLTEGNPIALLNQYLDTCELQQTTIDAYAKNYLQCFFECVYYNFFIKEKWGDHVNFPCTAEIATQEYSNNTEFTKIANGLQKRDDEKAQQKFYQKIKSEFNNRFKNYQKHIAIVQADGDNIGGIITKIFENEKAGISEFQRFSKQLFQFTSEAIQLVEDHGGTPLYGGGDDLSFFVPVADTSEYTIGNKTHYLPSKTMFELLDKIDELFKKKITDEFSCWLDNKSPTPSMSYGISVTYYKYPLNESLSESHHLLSEVAKQDPKNKTALSITKHSGASFHLAFDKGGNKRAVYNQFKSLWNLHKDNSKDLAYLTDTQFLRSVLFKIEQLEPLLFALVKRNETTESIKKALKNLFNNHFDEPIHLKTKKEQETDGTGEVLKPFLISVRDMIALVYEHYPLTNNQEKSLLQQHTKNLELITSSLKFLAFIYNSQDRDENV